MKTNEIRPGRGTPVCFDGVDNDDDGLIDYPFDPGCMAKGDILRLTQHSSRNVMASMTMRMVPLTFLMTTIARLRPMTAKMASAAHNAIIASMVMNGFVDYPNDPGCAVRGDLSEQDDPFLPACAMVKITTEMAWWISPMTPAAQRRAIRTSLTQFPQLYALMA